jgi:hypothetical protein
MSNFYILRSKLDGKYLTARLRDSEENSNERSSALEKTYLLLFKADFEALTYVNTHAGDLSSRLGVEFLSSSQIKGLLQRWGYGGVGLVEDPLLPQIKFLSVAHFQ